MQVIVAQQCRIIITFTYSVVLTGSLSLLATPYLTGFYSKNLILELAYGQYTYVCKLQICDENSITLL